MGKNNGRLKLKWEICNWKIHLLLILQLKEKKTWERKSEDVEGWNEMVSQQERMEEVSMRRDNYRETFSVTYNQESSE